MTTPSRIEINQAEAQHSTGPKTPSQLIVMPTEDCQAYQRHVESLIGEFDPQGVTESLLVQALADASWRLNRVVALEAKVFALADVESQTKALANLSMHSQRLSRQFERTVAQLRDLQKTRLTQEKRDLDNFLDVTEMFENRGETYNPSDDGFVFSQTKINQAILTRNRERVVEEAHENAA